MELDIQGHSQGGARKMRLSTLKETEAGAAPAYSGHCLEVPCTGDIQTGTHFLEF